MSRRPCWHREEMPAELLPLIDTESTPLLAWGGRRPRVCAYALRGERVVLGTGRRGAVYPSIPHSSQNHTDLHTSRSSKHRWCYSCLYGKETHNRMQQLCIPMGGLISLSDVETPTCRARGPTPAPAPAPVTRRGLIRLPTRPTTARACLALGRATS